MYDLFRKPAHRNTGSMTYPDLPYIKRIVADILGDVKAYYKRAPKRVDSDNLFGNILVHIPRRMDLDDGRYLKFVEDTAPGVCRAMGMTNTHTRGRVHTQGVTLGEQTDEVVLFINESIDLKHFNKHWGDMEPVKYLYHTRVDMGLPIMNNTTPGKGHGVLTVDVPLLALMYRRWRDTQNELHDQPESIYRFIGGYVLPNMLNSYIDIAFFNRLARLSQGIGIPKFPAPHPFYITDISQRCDRLCNWIIETQASRAEDIEQVVTRTPMLVKETLRDVMQLPKEPVTRSNEWALQIARIPYIRYLVYTAVKSDSGDKRFINEIYLTLIEARGDNIFSGVSSCDVVKHYRLQLQSMIDLLETKLST